MAGTEIVGSFFAPSSYTCLVPSRLCLELLVSSLAGGVI